MHHNHNRQVMINKKKLIEKIKENRDTHIKEYEEAVIAYRKKADVELKKLIKNLKDGDLKLNLSLTTPILRSSEYDKVIEMFEWEVSDEVTLTQQEFNEYIHDDNSSARSTKLSNSMYLG